MGYVGSKSKIYYQDDDFLLLKGDSFRLLKKITSGSIDMIFADPPYFLSGNGVTCQSGKMVSVNKANWDEKIDVKEKISFNQKWIRLCKAVLKDTGSIWVSGTLHNIYTIGVALELEGFQIINNITWQKKNPPPNLACRAITHSTETILWARKKGKKHIFNYKVLKSLNDNKQLKDVWTLNTIKKSEKIFGKHPTQKPLELLERIVIASTIESDTILDPFNGSGTSGIAAHKLNRKYIGIDNVEDYLEITRKRFENLLTGEH